MAEDVRGETWLVTGASRGIGLALARRLARRGASLVLSARDGAALLQSRALCLADGAPAVHVHAADLRDLDAVEGLARAAAAEGPVFGLANVAGYALHGARADRDPDELDDLLVVDAAAPMLLARTLAPAMVTRGRGAILTVASIAGLMPLPREAAYCAAKAFVASFFPALAEELRGTGVVVSTIAPGPVETAFFSRSGFPRSGAWTRTVTWSEPDEIARLALEGLERGALLDVPFLLDRTTARLSALLPVRLRLALARRTFSR